MAFDKVVDSAFLEAGLKKVGDSIRAKAGTSELLEFPDAMSAAVDAIDTSKPEQTKTATPSLSQQTIVPDSGKVLSGVTVEPITSTLLTSLDSDFKAENIAEGVNMFGVVGTMASKGVISQKFKNAILNTISDEETGAVGIFDCEFFVATIGLESKNTGSFIVENCVFWNSILAFFGDGNFTFIGCEFRGCSKDYISDGANAALISGGNTWDGEPYS